MPSELLPIRTDPELKNAFMESEGSIDRDGSQLVQDFKRQTAETKYNDWFTAQVEQGIAQADSGDLLSSESVDAAAIAWRGIK
ncbi:MULTISPECIES: CopG family ribbon-helix-helix protein [Leclercia]|uniref:CopG family ribbon-helix-helix protein n=1 Tax=Leclercia TaxID=83654 RepID=UPI0021D0EA38|nr:MULTISPECIES: hypothetical protein [Leclercia]MCU6682460.1 hypothetical protein [Leclercia tamurae]